MPKLKTALALSCVFILFSCGSSSENDDKKTNANNPDVPLTDQPVAGKIFGEDFVVKSGIAHLITSPENTWQVFLYANEAPKPCDRFTKHGSLYVGFISTLTKGRDAASSENNKNISLGTGGDTAHTRVAGAKGIVQIDESTETTATGRLAATYDAASQVNGSFTITKCPKKS